MWQTIKNVLDLYTLTKDRWWLMPWNWYHLWRWGKTIPDLRGFKGEPF